VKENTRLPEFMRPQPKQVLQSSLALGNASLGKRDSFSFNTPNLLGMYRETPREDKTPFNLKQMLGERSDSEDEEGDLARNSGPESSARNREFKPLRFPSPSPSRRALTG